MYFCQKANSSQDYEDEGNMIMVNISVDINMIRDISEINSFLNVHFDLHFSWFDSRLTFENLKNDSDLNTLSPAEKRHIWVPELVFQNTDDKQRTKVDSEATITVKKLGAFKIAQETDHSITICSIFY